jgi:hypothetical protein
MATGWPHCWKPPPCCASIAGDQTVITEGAWPMPDGGLPVLAGLLARAGVAVLICGGATCCCLAHFQRAGVAVAPWIAGDIDTVLTAVLENRLETLLAPGARPCRLPGPGRGISHTTQLEKIIMIQTIA